MGRAPTGPHIGASLPFFILMFVGMFLSVQINNVFLMTNFKSFILKFIKSQLKSSVTPLPTSHLLLVKIETACQYFELKFSTSK